MDPALLIAAFVTASCLVMIIGVLVSGRQGRLAERLKGISIANGHSEKHSNAMGQLAVKIIPHIAVPLIPKSQDEQGLLKIQLIRAGYYGNQAMTVFLGIKMLLIAVPLVIAFACGTAALVSLSNALMFGAIGSISGYLLPNFWLRRQEVERQSEIRKSLPDALDMMVICSGSGQSLDAAIQRTGRELRLAHPLLATELQIVSRCMEMGMSAPEGLEQLNWRFNLPELRYLTTIVREAERFGTSVSKSIRVHAETLRTQRLQRAEEAARKSSVKMLLPTILFIFPVIFLVVLVPSILNILRVFEASMLKR